MFIAHVHKRGLQGVFNCLMSLLNGSLGSCMVGGGKTNLNIESLQDILLQVWDKRIPIVWDIYMRNSIPWSLLKKGFGAFISSGLLHEVGFQPSGSPTEDCKKEPMTFRWWKRSNNIQVNSCETLGHWEWSTSALTVGLCLATWHGWHVRTKASTFFLTVRKNRKWPTEFARQLLIEWLF